MLPEAQKSLFSLKTKHEGLLFRRELRVQLQPVASGPSGLTFTAKGSSPLPAYGEPLAEDAGCPLERF